MYQFKYAKYITSPGPKRIKVNLAMQGTVPSLCLVCIQTQTLNQELETCGACAIDMDHTPFRVQSTTEFSLGYHYIILRPVLTPDSLSTWKANLVTIKENNAPALP